MTTIDIRYTFVYTIKIQKLAIKIKECNSRSYSMTQTMDFRTKKTSTNYKISFFVNHFNKGQQ